MENNLYISPSPHIHGGDSVSKNMYGVLMSFGGLGNNIFNPALVGRVFLLISFPAQMTTWPLVDALEPFPMTYTDAETGATVLALMKQGVQELPSYTDLLIGSKNGSLGEISALALLLGFAYMLWKKIITWHIPVSILATVFVFTGIICHFADVEEWYARLWRGDRSVDGHYPFVRFLSGRYVVRDLDHERAYAVD